MSRRAVVLLSGGLDSTTVAAMARAQGFELFALSIDYGQRHQFELTAARRVADTIGVARHAIVRVDLSQLASSALTDANIEVPKHRTTEEMDAGIPVTYVPARNTVFLTLALGWAEVLAAADIFLGVNALDYSGYPDCRPEYIAAFERLAGLATKAGVEGTLHFKIHTPLIEMTKAQIIEAGAKLGVNYGITHSCYDPEKSGQACGQCDACLLRLRGFAKAGLTDPIEYSNVS